MTRRDFFVAQKKILEEIFPDAWFHNPRKKLHPAFRAWTLCNKLINQNGIVRWPGDKEALSEIASIVLDGYFLVQCSGGNINNLSLGSFANYGDPLVRKRLFSVTDNGSQFQDLMTELSYAAWHLSKSHSVTAYEDIGFPDFRVGIASFPLPVVVDCKRVQKDTQEGRFSKIITKANRQIKALGVECFGLAAIDVSEKVEPPTDLSDAIPESLKQIEELTASAISKSNSSVSAVLLLWDDFVLLGEPGKTEKSLFAYRRRSRIVRHRNPQRSLPCLTEELEVGNTITYRITWDTINPTIAGDPWVENPYKPY